jgi:hypothetical protein
VRFMEDTSSVRVRTAIETCIRDVIMRASLEARWGLSTESACALSNRRLGSATKVEEGLPNFPASGCAPSVDFTISGSLELRYNCGCSSSCTLHDRERNPAIARNDRRAALWRRGHLVRIERSATSR